MTIRKTSWTVTPPQLVYVLVPHEAAMNNGEVLESASDSSVNEIEEENNQINDRFKKVEGYHAVPPLYTVNYMPSRPDLSFAGLDDSVYKTNVSETITSVPRNESTASKSSKDNLEQPKDVRPSAFIIEEWESNSDDDCMIRPSFEQNKPSYAKINFVKSDENTRKYVIEQHTNRQAENLRKSQSPRVDKRNFVPTAVLTKSGNVPVNTAKQSSSRAAVSNSTARYVNTAASRPTMNGAKPSSNVFHKSHSSVKRTIYQRTAPKNSDFKEKVNTAKVNNVTTAGTKAVVSAVQGHEENVVKSSTCWIWRPTGKVIDHISKDSGSYMPKRFDYGNPQYALQDQGIFDSGCSRHITGNKCYLTDYQDIDGGFVAFAGSPKGDDNNYLDYADSYVVLNLEKSLKNYKSFLVRMRKVKRSVPNDGELTSENLCNIILKYRGRKLTFKMNTHDYYLNGYKDSNGKLWELRISKDTVKRLRDSNPAGIGLTYPKLKGLKINYESLVTAFNQLAQMGPNTEISNDVASLCLVLAEGSRFNPIGTEFGNALCRGKEVIIDEWIVLLVKNWAYLSRIAALCKEKHVVLTDGEKDSLNSRDFSIFDLKGDEYSSSQRRMAKVVISVAHLPRVAN
ncbi:ribonuclease H-like domain-containing protein [Tanacetum coccineum]